MLLLRGFYHLGDFWRSLFLPGDFLRSLFLQQAARRLFGGGVAVRCFSKE